MRIKCKSKVSLVMPVYNKYEYIDMMLESVYKQEWDNIELIFVNDGATDGTREKLSLWEPKFLNKGFEIIIIDQENKGIPFAVKTGLLHVTGDYICLIDCDDKLDPKYVSTMAGWLDEHPEDDWTLCLWNSFSIENGVHKIFSTANVSFIPSHPNMMEKFLSFRYATVVWICMVRTNYLKKCRVVERFITDVRSTQEPGFYLPLILGGGNVKIFDKPLYNHNRYYGQTYWGNAPFSDSFSKVKEYQDKHKEITLKTITTLDADFSLKKKWQAILELAEMRVLLPETKRFHDGDEYVSDLASETAFLINKHFHPSPQITIENIVNNDYNILSLAISDCILGDKSRMPPRITGRVIGCGVLGNVGRVHVPKLIGTSLEPTDLWDQSAVSEDKINGIPVSIPDYCSLTSDDIVLVFPADMKIKNELFDILLNHRVENIITGTDIMEMMPALMYPMFYNKCEFVVDK